MTPEIAAELFYNGELEIELQTVGLSDYRFRLNSDREQCFEKIESIRRDSVYAHPQSECFSGCKERGNQNQVITKTSNSFIKVVAHFG